MADEPVRWQALGLGGTTDSMGRWHVVAGPLTVTVDPSWSSAPTGIVAWGLDREVRTVPEMDVAFLVAEVEPTLADARPPDPRLLGVDHVVLMTTSLEATCASIEQHLEAPLKRIREVGGGVRQGFHRLGSVIVEVVQHPQASPGPARCWGLVFTVADLDAMTSTWSDEVAGRPRPAVQPGRRIASLRRGAGVATAVAFMTPHVSVESPE